MPLTEPNTYKTNVGTRNFIGVYTINNKEINETAIILNKKKHLVNVYSKYMKLILEERMPHWDSHDILVQEKKFTTLTIF